MVLLNPVAEEDERGGERQKGRESRQTSANLAKFSKIASEDGKTSDGKGFYWENFDFY